MSTNAAPSRASRSVLRLQPEPQPARVPRRPEQPRRVVAEAGWVQHPDDAPLQVARAVERVRQVAPRLRRQRHRHGVDREVPACEVVGQRPRLDRRERPRRRVALPPGHDQVQRHAAHAQFRRPELRPVRRHAPQRPRQRRRESHRAAHHAHVRVRRPRPTYRRRGRPAPWALVVPAEAGTQRGRAGRGLWRAPHEAHVQVGPCPTYRRRGRSAPWAQSVAHRPADQVERHAQLRRGPCSRSQKLDAGRPEASFEDPEAMLVMCALVVPAVEGLPRAPTRGRNPEVWAGAACIAPHAIPLPRPLDTGWPV